ncbi:uncharacterized protein EKO05_0002211 [Ascochyta rabiei]|uniref:uncharacterized protein n=1 Tax=Didymella rabiei TaxID=5454 RepID=UPI00220B5E66|nr:uncharacterized protein EKO05_0002211 [Ascochyta rabiei]UPX11614.1 hypothetical protein EKO05_0002211 [Ascochyta rabiei]
MMEGQGQTARATRRSQTSAPTQQDFLFVNASDAKISRQGRRDARSFVMKKARSERLWSTSTQAARHQTRQSASPQSANTPTSTSTPSTASSSPSVESNGNRHLLASAQADVGVFEQGVCSSCKILTVRHGQILCPRCNWLRPTGLLREPNHGSLDPFGMLPVKMTKDDYELMYHFIGEMAPGIIGVDTRCRSNLMRSDWFATALSNAGFMHSLLCTAALHMFVSGRGRGNVEAILHHRAETIVAVNKAISSTEDHTVHSSDENLGAVFNLLTVEESLASPYFRDKIPCDEQSNATTTHLNGLRDMLSLRGGLGAVNRNRILQAFILWHSTAHAIAAFDSPDPAILEYIRTANYPRHPQGYCSEYSQHLVNLCRDAGLAAPLVELLEFVLVLAADLTAWYNDPESPLDPLDIQNFSCALECLLLAWIRGCEPSVTPLEGALCVALIIFTIRTTEAPKMKSDVHFLHSVASKRLESALNCTTLADWWPCQDLLLWILSIGAISAEGSAESTWFVHQSSLACAMFQIVSAEALLERLHFCGWVSCKLDEPVQRLWNSIRLVRCNPYPSVVSPYIDHTESPPGPLQNAIKEPELTDWRTIDWTAFIAANPAQESYLDNDGVSWATATATGFDDAFGQALTGS